MNWRNTSNCHVSTFRYNVHSRVITVDNNDSNNNG